MKGVESHLPGVFQEAGGHVSLLSHPAGNGPEMQTATCLQVGSFRLQRVCADHVLCAKASSNPRPAEFKVLLPLSGPEAGGDREAGLNPSSGSGTECCFGNVMSQAHAPGSSCLKQVKIEGNNVNL